MWVATAAESQRLDRELAVGLPEGELMRRAASAALRVCLLRFPSARKVLVLAGPGNNGGDAVLLAGLLREAGKTVVLAYVGRHGQADDPSHTRVQEVDKLPNLEQFDLVVDGLFGSGLNRDVTGVFADVISAVGASGRDVLALDIPSGIHADTGQILGRAMRATVTLELLVRKRFAFASPGAQMAGEWLFDGLGCEPAHHLSARLTSASEVWLPPRRQDAHKGSSGRVLVVAGSDQYHGAALLAALGALKAGAGLVTVASVPSVLASVRGLLPEALTLELPARDGVIAPEGAAVLRDHPWDSAVVGPGMGNADAFFDRLFADWRVPTCIDADALNAVSRGASLPKVHDSVLTPHPGEAARLLGCTAAEVNADRFGSAAALRDKYGGVVVLKGPNTLVARTASPIEIVPTGNPGMATGGMGDVLAGVISGLRPVAPTLDMVTTAVYLHGLAGDICAAEIGPVGYTASELAARIPKARAKLMPCPVPGSRSR